MTDYLGLYHVNLKTEHTSLNMDADLYVTITLPNQFKGYPTSLSDNQLFVDQTIFHLEKSNPQLHLVPLTNKFSIPTNGQIYINYNFEANTFQATFYCYTNSKKQDLKFEQAINLSPLKLICGE